MKAVYFDTSAYLAILLNQREAKRLRRSLAKNQPVSSVVLALEAQRNLVRLGREGQLSPELLQQARARLFLDLESFLLRDLTLDLCRDLELPLVATPRSLDLVHLQTALWFQREQSLGAFLTLDQKLRTAAAELGLPV